MKHPYRGMPLTGAPAARFPQYLLANQFDRYPDLDENGHDPKTFEIGASEHTLEATDGASEHATGCNAGWIDPVDLYITNADGVKLRDFVKQMDLWRRRMN